MGEVVQGSHAVPEPSMEKLATGQVWHVKSVPSLKNWFFPQHTGVDMVGEQRGVWPDGHVSTFKHGTHTVDPAVPADVPAAQVVQAVDEEAPVALENVPIAQAVQVALLAAPWAAEYVPAPQAVHVKLEAAPWAAEYVPVPQGVQVLLLAAPWTAEKVPATQGVQVALLAAPWAAE